MPDLSLRDAASALLADIDLKCRGDYNVAPSESLVEALRLALDAPPSPLVERLTDLADHHSDRAQEAAGPDNITLLYDEEAAKAEAYRHAAQIAREHEPPPRCETTDGELCLHHCARCDEDIPARREGGGLRWTTEPPREVWRWYYVRKGEPRYREVPLAHRLVQDSGRLRLIGPCTFEQEDFAKLEFAGPLPAPPESAPEVTTP